MDNSTKNVIQQMGKLGAETIPEGTSSLREVIVAALSQNPKKWFKQADFSSVLKNQTDIPSSGPYINNVLSKLTKAGDVRKEKRGRHAFYQFAPKE